MNAEQYLDEFERWTSGNEPRRKRIRAELDAHLRDAEQAGELSEAMTRLGPPREAARSFGGGFEAPPARWPRRILAFVLDAAVTSAVFVAGLGLGTWASQDADGVLPLQVVGVALMVLAGVWWPLGLTILEWRLRKTPGKALMGLEVMSEDGIAPSFGQVVVRRLTLVFSGPLQIIDWAFALFNDRRQRALDRLARTVVVEPAPEPAPGAAAPSPVQAL